MQRSILFVDHRTVAAHAAALADHALDKLAVQLAGLRLEQRRAAFLDAVGDPWLELEIFVPELLERFRDRRGHPLSLIHS